MRLSEKEAWESLGQLFELSLRDLLILGICDALYCMHQDDIIDAETGHSMSVKIAGLPKGYGFSKGYCFPITAGDRKRAAFCRCMAEECGE